MRSQQTVVRHTPRCPCSERRGDSPRSRIYGKKFPFYGTFFLLHHHRAQSQSAPLASLFQRRTAARRIIKRTDIKIAVRAENRTPTATGLHVACQRCHSSELRTRDSRRSGLGSRTGNAPRGLTGPGLLTYPNVPKVPKDDPTRRCALAGARLHPPTPRPARLSPLASRFSISARLSPRPHSPVGAGRLPARWLRRPARRARACMWCGARQALPRHTTCGARRGPRRGAAAAARS